MFSTKTYRNGKEGALDARSHQHSIANHIPAKGTNDQALHPVPSITFHSSRLHTGISFLSYIRACTVAHLLLHSAGRVMHEGYLHCCTPVPSRHCQGGGASARHTHQECISLDYIRVAYTGAHLFPHGTVRVVAHQQGAHIRSEAKAALVSRRLPYVHALFEYRLNGVCR